MSKSEYHKGLVRQTINSGIQSAGGHNKPAETTLGLAIAGITIFTGAELLKIFFRRNFDIHSIHKASLYVGSICFLLFGAGSMYYSLNNYYQHQDGSIATNSSFLITGIFYIVLSLYILRKGLLEIKAATNKQASTVFNGESGMLKILEEYKWSDNLIKYLAEPGYAFVLGALLVFYNPISAIPLIFCALSVWLQAVIESFLNSHFQHGRIDSEPASPSKPVQNNKVNSNF